MVDGKTVPEILVTKEMRKQIKFALKRGDKIEDIKKKIFLVSITVKAGHKTMFKVWLTSIFVNLLFYFLIFIYFERH